jgi:hypothetical protein
VAEALFREAAKDRFYARLGALRVKNIHKINKRPRNRMKWAAVEALVASPNAATREATEKIATSSVTQTHQISPSVPFGFFVQSTLGTPRIITKKSITAHMLSTIVMCPPTSAHRSAGGIMYCVTQESELNRG